jgi:hypothetical protein
VTKQIEEKERSDSKITNEQVNRVWKKYAIDAESESRGRSPIVNINFPGRQRRTQKPPDYNRDWSDDGR